MSCADTLTTTITITVAIFIESSMLAMIARQMFNFTCVFLKDVQKTCTTMALFPKDVNFIWRKKPSLSFKCTPFGCLLGKHMHFYYAGHDRQTDVQFYLRFPKRCPKDVHHYGAHRRRKGCRMALFA